MSGMTEEFSGTLALPEGRRERVAVVFTGDLIELRAGSSAVGAWSVDGCRIKRVGPREFRLEVEDEVLEFIPDRPVPFGSAVARHLKAARIADRIDAVRVVDEPPAPEPVTFAPPPPPADVAPVERPRSDVGTRVAGALATGLFVIMLAVAGALLLRGRNEPADAVPAPLSTTTSTTEALPSVFDLTPPELADWWNDTAARLGAPLRIRNRLGAGDFEARVTPFVTVQGSVGADGTVDSVVVAVDPTGDTRDDELAIVAWGVTIATVDPSLDGPGRRRLLDRLGLDLDFPDLSFLDGEAEEHGLRYTLRYLDEFTTVLFTVEPA